MGRWLLGLLYCLPAFSAWTNFAPLTYNSTLTGTAASNNFPALVSATDNSLCLTTNGTHAGYVQSSAGADIEFFADAVLTTQIASEIEYYSGSGSTCSVIAWVQISALSVTANGTIYIAVGNASPPPRVTTPWDSNYEGVWHLPNGTSLTANDSTTNANNASTITATATVGQVDCAAAFNSQYIEAPYSSSLNLTGALTMEMWFYTTNEGNYQSLVTKGSGSPSRNYAAFIVPGTPSSSLYICFDNGSSPGTVSVGAINAGAWYHLLISDPTSGTGYVYLNGVQAGTFTAASPNSQNTPLYFGWENAAGAFPLIGRLDEVRISNTARSASWAKASYNNQSAPGNIGSPGFWTWGSWGTVVPTLSVSSCSTATSGSPSTSCTVTVANGSFNGSTNTVSLADSVRPPSLGGVFTITGGSPGSFTSSGTVTPSSGTSFSFTYTPAIIGPRTITVTNGFSATNPSPWTMTVTSGGSCAFTMTGSGTQSIAATSGWTSTGGCGHSSPTTGDTLAVTASGGTMTITVPNDSTIHTLGTCPANTTTYDLQLTAASAGSAVFDVQPEAKFYYCGNVKLAPVATTAGSSPTTWADFKLETGGYLYWDQAQQSTSYHVVTAASNEWARLLFGAATDTCTYGPGATYSCPTHVTTVNAASGIYPLMYDPGSTADSHIFKVYGIDFEGGCGSTTAPCFGYSTLGSSAWDSYADAGAIFFGGNVFNGTYGIATLNGYGFNNPAQLNLQNNRFLNDLAGFGSLNGNAGGVSPRSCTILGNYFSGSLGYYWGLNGCPVSGNVLGYSISAGVIQPTLWTGNVIFWPATVAGLVDRTMTAPNVNNYHAFVTNASSNHGWATGSYNDYYRGNVVEAPLSGSAEVHFALAETGATGHTAIMLDNLSIQAANGNISGELYGWSNTSEPEAWIDHNGVYGNGVYSWHVLLGHAGSWPPSGTVLRAFRGNIGWAASAGASNFAVAPITNSPSDLASAQNNNVYVPNEAHNAWYNATSAATFVSSASSACPTSTSNGTPYNQCTASGTPGAGDQTVNPKFIDSGRNISKWAYAMQGQAQTLAGAEAALQGCQNLTYCIQQLLWYVKQGYQPTNLALRGAGLDGGVVGVTGTLGSGYSGACSAAIAVQDTDDLGSGAAATCAFASGVPSITITNPGTHYRIATPATVTITGTGGSGTSLNVMVSPSDIGPVPITLFAGVAP